MLQKFNKIKNAVSKSFKRFNKDVKRGTLAAYLTLVLILGGLMIGVNARPNHYNSIEKFKVELIQKKVPTFHKEVSDTTQAIPQSDSKDSIRQLLVLEIDNYISKRFPTSKLTGDALVTICSKHDFDIAFCLAQAQIESGFGTAGKGKKTNNPWNVGAYDSRSVQDMKKAGHSYTHPDQSIEPYVELVKTKYLGSNKTIHDLMKNYVNLSGHRYASGKGYETKLKGTYRAICTTTRILELFEKFQKEI